MMIACENRFCYAFGVLNSHTSNNKIYRSPANLPFEHTDIVDSSGLEFAELAPGGELGFDGKCDEDAHWLCSDAALKGGATKTKAPV